MANNNFVPQNSLCWFCSVTATTRNPQGLPVCQKHKKDYFEEKCPLCKGWLEVINGKRGEYFKCEGDCAQNFSLYKMKKLLEELL